VSAAVKLRLHKAQREVYGDKHRFRCVVAGRRWGKTQLSKITICTRASRPKQIIWYVAPTYGMARGIMWDALKDAIPRAWVDSYNQTRMEIRLHNQTRIELKGADNPDSLRGMGLNLLIIDEAQDIDRDTFFKILRPTLADTQGEAIIIGTPKAFNWLYEVYTLGQRGATYLNTKGKLVKNVWKSWQFPTITSPFIPRSEIAQARHDMDEKSFKQEFEASFETMSGRVYHTFDRKVHVGKYPFNPKLPIWIGMDFNIDPMSAVIMQPQKNGEIWIVDEAILPASNTQETADELQRRYFKHTSTSTVYPDPAGKSLSTKGRGKSDLDILRDAGFVRILHHRKHPPVADRINAVNRMFKSGDGTIRMRVHHTCKKTIEAFEQTIYKPGTSEVDKSQGFEHPADAVGYCIEFEFPVRKVKILGVDLDVRS
jgi:hypothetical protein